MGAAAQSVQRHGHGGGRGRRLAHGPRAARAKCRRHANGPPARRPAAQC